MLNILHQELIKIQKNITIIQNDQKKIQTTIQYIYWIISIYAKPNSLHQNNICNSPQVIELFKTFILLFQMYDDPSESDQNLLRQMQNDFQSIPLVSSTMNSPKNSSKISKQTNISKQNLPIITWILVSIFIVAMLILLIIFIIRSSKTMKKNNESITSVDLKTDQSI